MLSMAASTLQKRSWVVVTETRWTTQPPMFTIWLITEKVCPAQFYTHTRIVLVEIIQPCRLIFSFMGTRFSYTCTWLFLSIFNVSSSSLYSTLIPYPKPSAMHDHFIDKIGVKRNCLFLFPVWELQTYVLTKPAFPFCPPVSESELS